MKKHFYLYVLLHFPSHLSGYYESSKTEYETIVVDKNEAYDEFDCIADDLANKGLVPEKPQELSTAVIYARKIGGALFMKYLAVKGWTQKMWQWLFEKPKSQQHKPDCIHFKASSI